MSTYTIRVTTPDNQTRPVEVRSHSVLDSGVLKVEQADGFVQHYSPTGWLRVLVRQPKPASPVMASRNSMSTDPFRRS